MEITNFKYTMNISYRMERVLPPIPTYSSYFYDKNDMYETIDVIVPLKLIDIMS